MHIDRGMQSGLVEPQCPGPVETVSYLGGPQGGQGNRAILAQRNERSYELCAYVSSSVAQSFYLSFRFTTLDIVFFLSRIFSLIRIFKV